MDLFSNLSFKEKSTWITLIAIVVVFSGYFTAVFEGGVEGPGAVALFIGAVIALVVIQVVLHIIIAIANPKEANAPEDERDELIELKATRIAAFVLGFGAIMSASLWLLGFTPLMMANAILGSLVVAEIVQCVMQLVYYRMGV